MEFPYKEILEIDGVKVKFVGLHWTKNNTWIPKYKTIKEGCKDE